MNKKELGNEVNWLTEANKRTDNIGPAVSQRHRYPKLAFASVECLHKINSIKH